MKRVLIVLVVLGAGITAWFVAMDATRDLGGGDGRQLYTADGTFVGSLPAAVAKKNLVVLLLDTVRRDAVALGDEPRRQMPAFAQLARRGVAFRQAATAAPWTIPTVASVLTGLHPSEHGCREDGPAPKLLESIVTYAEALRKSFDFQTAAFSDVPWYRGASWSMLQGFETGSDGAGLQVRGMKPLQSGFWLHGSGEILDPWVESLDPDRPFFLFLHTYDAHDPFGASNHPPEILDFYTDAAERKAQIEAIGPTHAFEPWEILRMVLTNTAGRHALQQQRGPEIAHIAAQYAWQGYRDDPRPDLAAELDASYRAGCRFTDDGLAKLVQYLESKGLLEDTLFAVFSDHGEAFGEHGMIGHGRRLDEELVHVPLVMFGAAPFAEPRVIDDSVGVIDILPTFFDWIGAPDLPQTRGRSVLPLLRGESDGRPVITEATVTPEMVGGLDDRRVLESVRSARWKYVVEYDIKRGYIEERLYDLSVDPGEHNNLAIDGKTPNAFDLPADFCDAIEICRDRIWEAAASISARAFTPYSAGVATTDQERPAPCGK